MSNSEKPSSHLTELPTDRLATTDEAGHRVYLYPSDVRGRFRRSRTLLEAVLIVIFLAMPWIQIGSRHILLLDIAERKFTIFGVMFRAHDAPMLVFILAIAALLLALVTALFGRAWCGWACPQTVFIDGVFRRLERWIEGDSVERRRADAGPMTSDLFLKKAAKWSAYTVASLVIAHSVLAYFVDTNRLAMMIRQSPAENPTEFTAMMIITAVLLFVFGWFREQFCVIACPYGRLQSILTDEDSIQVAYDAKRGEPRKGSVAEGAPHGDCINCYRCVQVCPTGVDIRRGTQLECIGCTACADACDDVMTRQKKPRGLIGYASLNGLAGKATRFIRARTLIYVGILAILISGLTVVLARHAEIQATFVRAVDTPYQELRNAAGEPVVINRFEVDFSNQSFKDMKLTPELGHDWSGKGIRLIMPMAPLIVAAGKVTRADLFIEFPRSLLKSGHAAISVEVHEAPSSEEAGATDHNRLLSTEEVTLVGPFF